MRNEFKKLRSKCKTTSQKRAFNKLVKSFAVPSADLNLGQDFINTAIENDPSTKSHYDSIAKYLCCKVNQIKALNLDDDDIDMYDVEGLFGSTKVDKKESNKKTDKTTLGDVIYFQADGKKYVSEQSGAPIIFTK